MQNHQSQSPRFLNTADFAHAICRNPQTIRKNLCLTGEAYGIRPQKIGGRLLWPAEQVEKLCLGENAGVVQ